MASKRHKEFTKVWRHTKTTVVEKTETTVSSDGNATAPVTVSHKTVQTKRKLIKPSEIYR